MNLLSELKINHHPRSRALDLLKYIDPGLLVTVSFIDPGNWATNLTTDSEFGYAPLWAVTFSPVMLIITQHNMAHPGIMTGLCSSETINKYMPRMLSRPILGPAILASVSTSFAEILDGAIVPRMLLGMPIKAGAVIVTIICFAMLSSSTYSKTGRWIIAFVSIIGLSSLYELALVDADWGQAVVGWVRPTFPENSMLIIANVLGAVMMPHNLFLHPEVIQSREWSLRDESVTKKQLKYEFYDTPLSMVIGWVTNSAMIILATSTFPKQNTAMDGLDQTQQLLVPLIGNNAGVIFAAALLLADISLTIASSIVGASIFVRFYGEAYDYTDLYSRLGVLLSLVPTLAIIFLTGGSSKGSILSQTLLSVQLPIIVLTQVYLASSKRVMGVYVNSRSTAIILLLLETMVTVLNIALLISLL